MKGTSHVDIWAGTPGKWEQCRKGKLRVREEPPEGFLQRWNLFDLGFNRFAVAMTVENWPWGWWWREASRLAN